jgi:CBS domain-containing protein
MPRIAREIMETHVMSVSPESSLVDVQKLFVEEEIHGAPVVDGDNAIVGVITSADILRAVSEQHSSSGTTAAYLREVVEYSSADAGRFSEELDERLGGLCVEDHMTRAPVCVSPDATIPEIARIIGRDRTHRVLVVEGDHLVGLISTFDLVRLLEKEE